MLTPNLIDRINELALKQREGSLTAVEKEEQTKLRRIYIDNIKNQVKCHLDTVVEQSHSHECDCGRHHKH
jgi:uncharacterized protein YnzC (UPF0291/DUF896 family)